MLKNGRLGKVKDMNFINNLAFDYTVVVLPIDQLRPTEEINIDRAQTLSRKIAADGLWTRPIFIEHNHSVIMDGHHRCYCALQLGLSRVPCIQLSYFDPNVHVTSWSDQTPFDVDRIIQAGLSGHLLGFKATRHKLRVALPAYSIPLEQLI
jgi:L-serine kinase (ADP)